MDKYTFDCQWFKCYFKFPCIFFPDLFSISVGGGEPLHGLPVLCTRVLPILWGKINLRFMIYSIFMIYFYHMLSVTHSCFFFFVLDLNQGAGLLHYLPLGDPFRFLCVSVSGWKCASIHHAARRWHIFWLLTFLWSDISNSCDLLVLSDCIILLQTLAKIELFRCPSSPPFHQSHSCGSADVNI